MVALEGEITEWSIGWIFGSTHPFFTVDSKIVIHTWVVLLALLIVSIPMRWIVRKKGSVLRYLVLSYIQAFVDLCNQSLEHFSFAHFSFVTALFTFIFACNVSSLIPSLEEPTANLNTTLALGLTSFFYVQGSAILALGPVGYLKEYFAPFFLMFPIHVVGKLASIISISFRLFGNIFGSAIIVKIYMTAIHGSVLFELIGLLSGMNILLALFFGLFEGFLQAFVFAMLSLTYLSIALTEEEHS